MTKNDLITLPNPHLRAPSKKVGFIDERILALVERMKTITLDWEAEREHEVGVALAAIQIDEPLRVIVVRNDFDNKSDTNFRAFINPVITKYEGDIVEDFEGCLSVKDLYGKVPRYNKVRVKALDVSGKEVRISAEGFLARVFQHEIDHTNGKVFLDHIKDSPLAFYTLNEEGNLQQLDYEKDVKGSKLLWSD
ncbi:MAG TPA: peptide deformylase [Candidatus Saccharimonadales bacterium]|nr:peptide deformylase [Candidatus Saccharimonadales bacterium]